MSDADKNFKIKITTAADTAGVKLTKDEIDRLAAAIQKLSDKQKDAAKDADKLELSHRELRHGLNELGNVLAPGAGRALAELASGPLGPLLALGAVIEFIKKQIEDTASATEELRKHQAELDSAVFESQAKATEDAAKAAREYNDLLKDIVTNTNALKEADDKRLAVLGAIFNQQKAIADQQEKAELTAAEGNPVEQARIKQKYGDAASEAELQQRAARIAEEERAKSENAKAGGEALGRFNDASVALDAFKHSPESDAAAQAGVEADYNKTKAGATYIKLLAETGAKNLEEAQNVIAARQAEAASHAGEPSEVHTPSGSFVTSAGFARASQNAAERLLNEYNESLTAQSDNNATVTAHTEKLAGLSKAVSDAEAEVKKYAEAVKTATAAIDTHKEVLKIDTDTAKTRQATAGMESPFGKSLLDERGDAAKIWTGHADQVGQDSKTLIEQLGALIAGHAVSLQEAARLVITADANQNNFLDALRAINATGDAMKNFSAASAKKFDEVSQTLKQHAKLISDLHTRSPIFAPGS